MIPQSSSRLTDKARQWQFELTWGAVRDALAVAGIDVLVLKGPHLACTVYEDPGVRKYGDLDLLVRPGDFSEAVRILLEKGYQPCKWDSRKAASSFDKYNWGFRSPLGVAVELHRNLAGFSRFCVDPDALFRASVLFNFGSTEARGLGTEDLLAHLCLHAGKSYFYSIEIKHLVDVARLVGSKRIDWPIFLRKCRSFRIRVASFYTLLAAARVQGAAIPETTLDSLKPSCLRRFWLERRLTTDRFPMYRFPGHSLNRIRRTLILPLMDRVSDWVVFLVRLLWLTMLDVLFRWKPLLRIWLRRRPHCRDFVARSGWK